MYEELNRLTIDSSKFVGGGKTETDNVMEEIKNFAGKYIDLEWEYGSTDNYYIYIARGKNAVQKDFGIAFLFKVANDKITDFGIGINDNTTSGSSYVWKKDGTWNVGGSANILKFNQSLTAFANKDVLVFLDDQSFQNAAFIVKEQTVSDPEDVYFYKVGRVYTDPPSAVRNSRTTGAEYFGFNVYSSSVKNTCTILYP